MDHLLSWIVFLPAIGAGLCLFVPKQHVRSIAVLVAAGTLLLSLMLFPTFLGGDTAEGSLEVFGSHYGTLHHVERAVWIQGGEIPHTDTNIAKGTAGHRFTVEYFLGVDGISFPLVVLTTLIAFAACVASWNAHTWKINKGLRAYFILFLLLETGMLGVFVSLDYFLFYVFWEIMLLPMYFLIGVWGGRRKEYAAIKFFLFTLAGSILMLVALVTMYLYSGDAVAGARAAEGVSSIPSGYITDAGITGGTFDLIELATNGVIQEHFNGMATSFLGFRFAPMMFMFLFIGFAIKLPIVPFHTWLPDAHVEAPTPISMILAGVLLKMGGYGFLRICYPVFPSGAHYWAFAIGLIGVVSIIYGALCAMAQTDFKRLVAYSSVSHMGFVTLGLAVMTTAGFQGAMFQMLAHGISSPMCFFLVGVIYDRAHHRDINRFGGLWLTMPKYGTMATIGFFASLGLPGLCGFIGEVWVLLGTFAAKNTFSWAVPMAIVAAASVILTAGYILWLIRRVYLGTERDEYRDFPDASAREMGILIPLAALCIVMGVLPMQTVFNFTNGTLNQVLAHVLAAVR